MSLGTFAQWELTAAQRSFLLGPDKSTGKTTHTPKPTKRLSMAEMQEKNRRSQAREKEKHGVTTA